MAPATIRQPTDLQLAWLIARDANLTFGGGTATAEVLRRSFVGRGWLTDDDHRRLYAISRLTPGTNLLAYCTALGWRSRGPRGAAVAWLASSMPAAAMAVLATILYDGLSSSKWLSVALVIATAIALVLLLRSAWHLVRPQFVRAQFARSMTIAAIVLAAMAAGMATVAILLSSAAIGALWIARDE